MVACTVYSNAVLEISKGSFNLATDTYVITLVNNSYVPAPNTNVLWSSVSANELTTAGGYTAGGLVLASQADTLSSGIVTFTAANPVWTAFSAGPFRYGVIVRRAAGTIGSNDLLLCYVDFGVISGTGGSFTVTVPLGGIFEISRSSFTAGGVPIPSGWSLQRLDTLGTSGSIPGPVRMHSLYYESAQWNRDADGRTFIPNGIINGQQQTYQHFEDPTFLFMSDRLRIQGRGQGDNSIKSGQLVSSRAYRSFIFEARFTSPATLGTWIEFWAFASGSGGDTSELDVEIPISVNGSYLTTHDVSLGNHGAFAAPTIDDSHVAYNSDGSFLTVYHNPSFDNSTGPHYYTIYYDDTGAGETRRYLDGVLMYHAVGKWNSSVGGTGFGPDAQLMIDLACGTTFGGQFPGTIASPSTWVGDMDIYSIGIYTPGATGRAIPVGEAWNIDHINSHVTLSNGDLTVSTATDAIDQPCYALDGVMSGAGKYYWEIVTNGPVDTPGAGVGTYSTITGDNEYLGKYPNSLGWFNNGIVVNNNATVANWATYGPTGSVRLCFALDMVNFKIWGRVGAAGNWNNAVIGSQNPATNTGGVALPGSIRWFVVPAVNLHHTSDVVTGAFASGSWVGTPPAGFSQIGPT